MGQIFCRPLTLIAPYSFNRGEVMKALVKYLPKNLRIFGNP